MLYITSIINKTTFLKYPLLNDRAIERNSSYTPDYGKGRIAEIVVPMNNRKIQVKTVTVLRDGNDEPIPFLETGG